MIVRTVLTFSLLLAHVAAFQFMKGWKMPKRNRGAKAAVKKFGDKSECVC